MFPKTGNDMKMKFNIIGSEEQVPFDIRLFNASTFIAAVFGTITVLINLINQYPPVFSISVCITAVSFATFYYLSRFRGITNPLKIPFLAAMLISIGYAWFFCEGILGSTPYLFSLTCLVIPFIFKRARYLILAILVGFAIMLILTNAFLPELIMPYPSYGARFTDISFTFMVILMVSGYTLILFIRNLDRERKTIERQTMELKMQKDELSTQAKELETINLRLIEMGRFKELMTGMVIHDLKNPLSSIIGLSNQDYSERNMSIIRQSGKQMLNLVTNILDVQRMETTGLMINCQQLKLSELIEKSISELVWLIDEKNLQIHVSGNYQSDVFADRELITRVITNILTNAVKFSDNNAKIMIACDDLAGAPFLKVSIVDFGPGIEPGKLEYVFDKFAQIQSRKSGALRSTGLGLAFCKMVIKAHEYAIGVDSIPNQSTTFWFTLKRPDIPDAGQKIENLHLTKKTKINLNAGDIEYLMPHLRRIAELKYYESGKLVPLISSVDEHFSENISRWKSEMEHVVYSNNEARFLELTRMD
jgi:signal transduction histidine kinase